MKAWTPFPQTDLGNKKKFIPPNYKRCGKDPQNPKDAQGTPRDNTRQHEKQRARNPEMSKIVERNI